MNLCKKSSPGVIKCYFFIINVAEIDHVWISRTDLVTLMTLMTLMTAVTAFTIHQVIRVSSELVTQLVTRCMPALKESCKTPPYESVETYYSNICPAISNEMISYCSYKAKHY